MQSETQFASQLLNTSFQLGGNAAAQSSGLEAPKKATGASFYSFNQNAVNNNEASPQNHYESLNVLNFNRMKDELQKMFAVDEIQTQVGAQRKFTITDEMAPSTDDRFQREMEMRQIVRDSSEASPYNGVGGAEMPNVGEITPIGLLNSRIEQMHSHGKVTFGRAKYDSEMTPVVPLKLPAGDPYNDRLSLS